MKGSPVKDCLHLTPLVPACCRCCSIRAGSEPLDGSMHLPWYRHMWGVVLFSVLAALVPGCGDTRQDPGMGKECIVGGQWLTFVTPDLKLHYKNSNEADLHVGYSLELYAEEPGTWLESDVIELAKIGMKPPYDLKVFIEVSGPECRKGAAVTHVYRVVDSFPPAAGVQGSTAVDMSSAKITGWADRVVSFHPGEEVDAGWLDGSKALGPARGNSEDVLSLGRGGSVVLELEKPAMDGPGFDIAVFENSFNDTFLELAFVDVSSDGENFVSFDAAYLGKEKVGPYGSLDPGNVHGLAGKYRQGFGTPFDLGVLKNEPEVILGEVNLEDIRFVRIRDVIGDGSVSDSFGNPIFDPFPTEGSAGFDLDAVAVINARSSED